MQKTPVEKEKQGELLSVLATLDAQALQGLLLERAKQAALAMAVALLEQDAEALCGPRYARKGEQDCHRGGSERSSVILEGARYAVRRPRVRKENVVWRHLLQDLCPSPARAQGEP